MPKNKVLDVKELASIFDVPIEMLNSECKFDVQNSILRDVMKSCAEMQDAIIKSQLKPKKK